MAEVQELEEYEDLRDLQDEPWEERTLNLLQDSKIDKDFAKVKAGKRGQKKHKVRWMKRPMAIPQVILELQEEECREAALRSLSTFLLEKREEDPENYYRTGYLLYNSCSTMAILLQELLTFYGMMVDEGVNVRAAKRLANVLTLLQCIAANKETRHKFVKCLMPSFLPPLIKFKTSLEVYENVRAVALSVVGILCEAREPTIIFWAIQNSVVEVCLFSILVGNELSKVIGMHIIEAILQDDGGRHHICSLMCENLLKELMNILEDLVSLSVMDKDFSPRLLFHIIRCYVLLCNNERGFSVVKESLPNYIMNGYFNDITEEFPAIASLLQQLLLTVGKVDNCSNHS